jgi:signal transduction histidine kinase
MTKMKLKIIVTLLLIIGINYTGLCQEKKVRTVVIFYSYYSGLAAYQNLNEGFNSTFKETSGEQFNTLIEYLDLGRIPGDIYGKDVVEIYNKKLREQTIDLIITFGPMTYPFLKNAGLEALKHTPVICVESYKNFKGPGYYVSPEITMDIVMKRDLHKTLETAFNLFPHFRDIYVVSGNGEVDHSFESSIKEIEDDFSKKHNFIYISGLTFDSTLRKIELIPENSIVLVTYFTEDSRGITFLTPEVISIVANISKAPVLAILDTFIRKKGAIGGYVFSYTNVGREMGIAARKILAGADPGSVKVNYDSFYQTVFDWELLKKWGLLGSKAIPKGSIYINENYSFLEKYEWYVVGILIFLSSQTILIMYLIRLNRRQKKISLRMLETENIYREIIREDRMAKMTELTASLSHELNQPLTGILYCAQAGDRFLRPEGQSIIKAQEMFNNIIEDSKRAGGIISSVKNLMKLETRENERVDINSIIQETFEIIRNDAIKLGIKLSLRLDASPLFIFADKVQIQQVLMNLIRNAENAMENNNKDNKIIRILTYLSGGFVTVSVCDTGCGINSEAMEKLFKPFFTTKKGGSGIGLALSRSIIQKHKGEIWAENIEGGGAMFSFRLPKIKNGRD